MFALFLDILGTSNYFKSLSDNHDFVAQKDDYLHGYTRLRREFQRILSGTASGVDAFNSPYVPERMNGEAAILCAIFSDCAYVVSSNPIVVLHEAGSLMRSFLDRQIPVRGGIGFGNFGFDRTVSSSTRSHYMTEASFFGSAIVRAHEAEGCGLKGLRVFIHDSAVSQLAQLNGANYVFAEQRYDTEDDGRPPTLPGTVIRLRTKPVADVTHEICYINYNPVDVFYRKLAYMRDMRSPKPPHDRHYDETHAAFEYFNQLRTKRARRAKSAVSK